MDYLQYYGFGYQSNDSEEVLNLVINGLPSILETFGDWECYKDNVVLNLVINGLPSILNKADLSKLINKIYLSFKPCYKWITFNT